MYEYDQEHMSRPKGGALRAAHMLLIRPFQVYIIGKVNITETITMRILDWKTTIICMQLESTMPCYKDYY